MKRSDEIEALANRLAARAASKLYPGEPEMNKDLSAAVPILREKAAAERAKEEAATANGRGRERPAITPTIAG